MSRQPRPFHLLTLSLVLTVSCGGDTTTPEPVTPEPEPPSGAPAQVFIEANRPPPPSPRPQFPVWPVPIPADSLFEPVIRESFADLPPAGPPAQCAETEDAAGCWFIYDPDGNFSIADEPDAPESPPGVLRIRYAAGLLPGYGPGLLQGWIEPTGEMEREYRAIRESGWVRVPSPSFEMQKAGVKFLGYVGVGQQQVDGIPSQVLFWSDHPGVPPPTTVVNMNVIQQAFQERKLPQNVFTEPLFTFGTWHHYEYLMVVNDLGKSNGRLQMWWDGFQILDYDDVEFRTETYPSGFFGRRWHPIWGGAGGSARLLEEYLEVDDLTLEGVPLVEDTTGFSLASRSR